MTHPSSERSCLVMTRVITRLPTSGQSPCDERSKTTYTTMGGETRFVWKPEWQPIKRVIPSTWTRCAAAHRAEGAVRLRSDDQPVETIGSPAKALFLARNWTTRLVGSFRVAGAIHAIARTISFEVGLAGRSETFIAIG
jgi:hypothetical protein